MHAVCSSCNKNEQKERKKKNETTTQIKSREAYLFTFHLGFLNTHTQYTNVHCNRTAESKYFITLTVHAVFFSLFIWWSVNARIAEKCFHKGNPRIIILNLWNTMFEEMNKNNIQRTTDNNMKQTHEERER